MTQLKPLELERNETTTSKYLLILHNDDFNTFEHVIDCLVNICKFDSLQAEQCATIVHFKGEYNLKSGSKDVLLPTYTKLKAKGLTVSLS